MAYRLMTWKHRVPRGIYTEKHNIVFAEGKGVGCECWILLAHRTSTRLRHIDGVNNSIELRICIQNITHKVLSVPLNGPSFEILCRTGTHDVDDLPVSKVKAVALNGQKIQELTTQKTKKSRIELNPLEFVVLSLEVICPADMEFETDFLARAKRLTLQANAGHSATHPQQVLIEAKFIDEDVVWDHYVSLPGGAILLRGDCFNE
jgi:hypothetical protein